jgi:hypothetical protein
MFSPPKWLPPILRVFFIPHFTQIWNPGGSKVVDTSVKKILLVELVQNRIAPLQPREFAIFLKEPQTDCMKRSNVHFMQIELDAKLGQRDAPKDL